MVVVVCCPALILSLSRAGHTITMSHLFASSALFALSQLTAHISQRSDSQPNSYL